MPVSRLKEYLDRFRVKYFITYHSAAYTAMEIAAAAHIPGKKLAKPVMVRLDGELAMIVIPAPQRLNFKRLATETGCKNATLASEVDFQFAFPGCEIGAMPPFGNLWHVPVYVGASLVRDDYISFNAGSHTEVMTLAFRDFMGLVEPTEIDV
jgi:Ala-tRNA(Pro) deacylase